MASPLLPNLVISVAEIKDLDTWKLASRQLLLKLRADHYWLITPDEQIDQFQKVSPPEFEILPESEFTVNYLKELKDKFSYSNDGRYGWYLQQFIKLSALKSATNFDRIVLWDADTIPLNEINFFDPKGCGIYYFMDGYHLPYFMNIDKLLNLDRIVPYSFIAQNFPITNLQVNSFFTFLEQKHQKPWYTAILDTVDFQQFSGFSEYEVLGTFISHLQGAELNLQSGQWSRGLENRLPPCKVIAEHAHGGSLDFIAFESWRRENTLRSLLLQNTWTSSNMKKKFKFRYRQMQIRLHKIRKYNSRNLDRFIGKIFESIEGLEVLQVGANDGIQSDPLRKHLLKEGNYTAILVEPIPHYVSILERLYAGRDDISVLGNAVGSEYGFLPLFHIPPEVAIQMNGTGPQNNWALGQGSFSRATVVYWIHMNSFRGNDYRNHIIDYISSIQELNVSQVPTSKLVMRPDKTLLCVDVRGFELEVMKGLNPEKLPRWIVMEEDLGEQSARNFLMDVGYRGVRLGSDWYFELSN